MMRDLDDQSSPIVEKPALEETAKLNALIDRLVE